MKKTLMMLAIAACAVSAQAKNSTQAQENATAGIGYQLRENPNKKPMTDSDVSYTSVYSLSADTLAEKMDVDKGLLTIASVEKWLKDSFAENSSSFKSAATKWTVANGVQPWLTDKDGAESRTALIARTAADDTSVENNEWVLAFYDKGNDGKDDYFRVAHAITGGTGDKVKNSKNVLDLSLDSFVVYNGTQGSKSEWGQWVAVPEPTSGMLMLLGLAGLALKRKRA